MIFHGNNQLVQGRNKAPKTEAIAYWSLLLKNTYGIRYDGMMMDDGRADDPDDP